MVWVKAEYADELAVVSAWIAALLPWYAAYASNAGGWGPRVRMRFPFLQFQYYLALPNDAEFSQYVFASPWTAKALGWDSVAPAYDLWFVGAVLLGVALVLSLAMYYDVDATRERLPVHPVRVMGSLLVGASLFFAGSTVQFYRLNRAGELPIPLGLALLVLLGVLLLRVDLVEVGTGDAADADSSEARPRR